MKPPYKAADFSLIGSDDERHQLKEYHGSWLVVYVYPEDDTPGCTVEACSIRDSHRELIDAGVRILGVSMDTPESHRAFRDKHNLPFVLLSDPTGAMIRAYGAWGKKMFGHEGIQRKTFIIDPEGVVQKVYGRVNPIGHGDQLLQDIRQLQN
jgi:peroxiredoxin Q/BCP